MTDHREDTGRPMRILLIEHNQGDVAFIRHAIAADVQHPMRLEVTTSTRDALEVLRGTSFDLVLLDLDLPNGQGEAFLGELHAAFPGTPIIVLVDSDDLSVAERCFQAGAMDVLVKGRIDAFVSRAIYHAGARAAAHKTVEGSYRNIRRMVADSHDPILVLDLESRVRFANEAAARLFSGRAVEGQLFGFPLADDGSGHEIDVPRPDGTVAVAEIRSNDTVWHGAPARVVSFRDITERKRMEAERERLESVLRQSQKLEAIGTLAGGVAHDFNNLLTTILGHAELALSAVDPGDPLCEYLEEIKKAAGKGANLTRQLLSFSRKETRAPRPLDLNDTVDKMEKMLRPLIREDIDVVSIRESNLWKVHMDSSQVDQVIMNLVVNARDAMPDGGTLTIETANTELDRAYFAGRGLDTPSGEYVMLSVSDTGVGMDEATRSRMFDPFFTTKTRETGTGLGLATVYGIVKQNRGYVWSYSEPGHGTTVKVYFPRAGVASSPDQASGTATETMGGEETILVVEDNDAVRRLTCTALRRFGYRVLEAPSGKVALEIGQACKETIHLLLTDVVMPGMSGKALSDALQARCPGLVTLYMSGYTNNVIVKKGVLSRDVHYLQKPFSPSALARKVREILDQ